MGWGAYWPASKASLPFCAEYTLAGWLAGSQLHHAGTWPVQGTVALELRGALASAQAQAAAAEERAAAAEGRVAAAEERHQQLEAALNESHSSLQQRNAELALVQKVG